MTVNRYLISFNIVRILFDENLTSVPAWVKQICRNNVLVKGLLKVKEEQLKDLNSVNKNNDKLNITKRIIFNLFVYEPTRQGSNRKPADIIRTTFQTNINELTAFTQILVF